MRQPVGRDSHIWSNERDDDTDSVDSRGSGNEEAAALREAATGGYTEVGSLSLGDGEEAQGNGAHEYLSSSSDSEGFADVGVSGAAEVVYVKEAVAIWPAKDRQILGRLRILRQQG
jgi:hypothetical protein